MIVEIVFALVLWNNLTTWYNLVSVCLRFSKPGIMILLSGFVPDHLVDLPVLQTGEYCCNQNLFSWFHIKHENDIPIIVYLLSQCPFASYCANMCFLPMYDILLDIVDKLGGLATIAPGITFWMLLIDYSPLWWIRCLAVVASFVTIGELLLCFLFLAIKCIPGWTRRGNQNSEVWDWSNLMSEKFILLFQLSL